MAKCTNLAIRYKRLIRVAAELFRKRGYHGVGLSELLTAAKAPKGSLCHHFPDGKSDLAPASVQRTHGSHRLTHPVLV